MPSFGPFETYSDALTAHTCKMQAFQTRVGL